MMMVMVMVIHVNLVGLHKVDMDDHHHHHHHHGHHHHHHLGGLALLRVVRVFSAGLFSTPPSPATSSRLNVRINKVISSLGEQCNACLLKIMSEWEPRSVFDPLPLSLLLLT